MLLHELAENKHTNESLLLETALGVGGNRPEPTKKRARCSVIPSKTSII
jgi:hypothetical protein